MDTHIGQHEDILHFEDSFTSPSTFHVEVNIELGKRLMYAVDCNQFCLVFFAVRAECFLF